jgi:hypothetical protein
MELFYEKKTEVKNLVTHPFKATGGSLRSGERLSREGSTGAMET